MSWRWKAKKWQAATLNEELTAQLTALKNLDQSLEERFYKDLEFVTGGMCGMLGVGTDQMIIYMIRKVAEGLARYMDDLAEEVKQRGVVIAYVSRHKSKEFALEV